jgi:hypothetical protein
MINSCAAFVILNGTQWSEGSGLRVGQAYRSQARSLAFGSEPALSIAEGMTVSAPRKNLSQST